MLWKLKIQIWFVYIVMSVFIDFTRRKWEITGRNTEAEAGQRYTDKEGKTRHVRQGWNHCMLTLLHETPFIQLDKAM